MPGSASMSRLTRWPARGRAVTVLVASLVAAHAAGAQEPTIATSFSVGATEFTDAFPEETRTAIEDSIGRLLAELGRANFPYLNWVPASTITGDETPRLRITMRQDSLVVTPDRPPCLGIHLNLAGDTPDMPIVGTFEDVGLYPMCELFPTEPADLLRDLTRLLTDLFTNEAFRKGQLQEALLSRIAVADSLIVLDDAMGHVLMRLLWDRTAPDPQGTRVVLGLEGAPRTEMFLVGPGPSPENFIIWKPEELWIRDNTFTDGMVSRFNRVRDENPDRGLKAFFAAYEMGRLRGSVRDLDVTPEPDPTGAP